MVLKKIKLVTHHSSWWKKKNIEKSHQRFLKLINQKAGN